MLSRVARNTVAGALGKVLTTALAFMVTPVVGDLRYGPLDVWSGTTLWPLARCLASFVLGMVAWRLANSPFGRGLARSWAGDAVLAGALGLAWMVSGADVAIVLLCVRLVLQLCTDASLLARLLASSPLHFLGQISYAVYLIHVPVHGLLPTVQNRMQQVGIPHAWSLASFGLIVGVVALAWIAYTVVEKPARHTARGWFAPLPSRPIDAEPGAP